MNTLSLRKVTAALLVLLTVAACSGGSGNENSTDLAIALEPAPEGYTGAYLTVSLAEPDGAPVTDATVSLEGNMNHAGMVPVLTEAVLDEADGATDGRYQAPFAFTMMGDWIITVKVERADGSTVTQNIDVRANEAGVVVDMEGQGAMPSPEPDTLTILNAMSRPSPLAAGNGAAYMTILNGFDTDTQLVAAESDAAEVVELHETVDDNGVMRMLPRPKGFSVPTGGMVELKPGGKHVMLIGLIEALEPGNTVEITLIFDNGESLLVTVPVTEMSGEMPAGMEHEGGSD